MVEATKSATSENCQIYHQSNHKELSTPLMKGFSADTELPNLVSAPVKTSPPPYEDNDFQSTNSFDTQSLDYFPSNKHTKRATNTRTHTSYLSSTPQSTPADSTHLNSSLDNHHHLTQYCHSTPGDKLTDSHSLPSSTMSPATSTDNPTNTSTYYSRKNSQPQTSGVWKSTPSLDGTSSVSAFKHQNQDSLLMGHPGHHHDPAPSVSVPSSQTTTQSHGGTFSPSSLLVEKTGRHYPHNTQCDAHFNCGGDVATHKLVTACVVCLIFMIVEVIAGIFSNSLALLTDASHLLSDLCSYLISLFAIWVCTLPGSESLSFGYHRAEILGAVMSVWMIWGVTAGLIYFAIQRLMAPPFVDGRLMFITALFGTLANLFMTHILKMHSHGIGHVHGDDDHHHQHTHQRLHVHPLRRESEDKTPVSDMDRSPLSETSGVRSLRESCGQDKDVYVGIGSYEESVSEGVAFPKKNHQNQHTVLKSTVTPSTSLDTGDGEYCESYGDISDPHVYDNMNLRAAYVHAVGDLLQNVGVMIASALIWWKPHWAIADPICTITFSIFVLLTTVSIVREAINVLMEGTPVGVDFYTLQTDLLNIDEVVEVHDLHVWSLSVGKPALACHIVVANEDCARRTLRKATEICQNKYRILHTTIQTDFSANKSCCDTSAHSKCLNTVKYIPV